MEPLGFAPRRNQRHKPIEHDDLLVILAASPTANSSRYRKTSGTQEPMSDSIPALLLRSLDASFNRAAEAVRVVEDFVRFVLDDAHLSGSCKTLRHELASLAAEFPLADRLSARETQQDVGTQITTEAEKSRVDAWDVCQANLHRLQESLRSLEEFSKTVSPELASRFESLRYQTYTLAKAIGTQQHNDSRLADARLYMLLPTCQTVSAFQKVTTEICQAGADVVQLRAKNQAGSLLTDRELVERARAMVAIARKHSVLSIVNDRPDIARIAMADGVHVGQDELSVKDARTVLEPKQLVGVSTHNVEQLRQAILDGANYVGLGPTFPTTTKQFNTYAGLDYLKAAAAETSLPSFAIGGITLENLPKVLATGVSRIAVSSAISDAESPAHATEQFKTLLALNA